jgi:hypothetical protein
MKKTKEELLQDKKKLFWWMDECDAHGSTFAIEELRIINEKLSKL